MKISEAPKNKVVVVLGPTATGKSDLAVDIAKWLRASAQRKGFRIAGAEIVSADSRQVYRGLDLASGKVPNQAIKRKSVSPNPQSVIRNSSFIYHGIPHHLLDVTSLKKRFSSAEYELKAIRAIGTILERGAVPILCGGTAFYVNAALYEQKLPEIPPSPKLRAKLERETTEALFEHLESLDPERAATIDPRNRRRLVRALEIVMLSGKPVPREPREERYETLKIGITLPPEDLRTRIARRLRLRLRKGMVREIETLHRKGVPWERFEELGLEARFASRYLRGLIPKEDMVRAIENETWGLVRRQMTWFKKDKGIHWIKKPDDALPLVDAFLKKKRPH